MDYKKILKIINFSLLFIQFSCIFVYIAVWYINKQNWESLVFVLIPIMCFIVVLVEGISQRKFSSEMETLIEEYAQQRKKRTQEWEALEERYKKEVLKVED